MSLNGGLSDEGKRNQGYVPIRFSDATMWDEIREQAAHLVALNDQPDREICRVLGMEVSDLLRLRASRKFMERVAEIREDINYTLIKQGIANKQNRINEANRRWKQMQQLMFERSNDSQMDGVAGGKTGLLTVTYKAGGRLGWQAEYVVDTGLLSEMRALELQVAKELGQITDKHSVDITARQLTVNVVAEIDKYEQSFANAILGVGEVVAAGETELMKLSEDLPSDEVPGV